MRKKHEKAGDAWSGVSCASTTDSYDSARSSSVGVNRTGSMFGNDVRFGYTGAVDPEAGRMTGDVSVMGFGSGFTGTKQ